MILVHILTNDQKLGEEIADFLVTDRLVVDALITSGVKRSRNDSGEVISETQTLIRGKTKALLFDTIDQILKKKYGSRLPTIYSVPIVHMDWEQSAELREQTKQV